MGLSCLFLVTAIHGHYARPGYLDDLLGREHGDEGIHPVAGSHYLHYETAWAGVYDLCLEDAYQLDDLLTVTVGSPQFEVWRKGSQL